MKKTDETIDEPGAVLINCRAGRTVLAVVCTAPETRPSTSSTASIMVPSTTVSSSCASACCGGQPLGLAQLDHRRDVAFADASGSRISRPAASVMPCDAATPSILALAEQHAVGDAFLLADDGGAHGARLLAFRQHDALDCAARAFWMSW
jgi:hypothetical protein